MDVLSVCHVDDQVAPWSVWWVRHVFMRWLLVELV